MGGSKRRYRCPDCGRPLARKISTGKRYCNNPMCPVIWVIFERGWPHKHIIKIARTAEARAP